MNLNSYKYIFFLGIGGIGMSALARYFNAKGKQVFGYDKQKSELCCQLEIEGIQIIYNEKEKDLPKLIFNAKQNEILLIYTPAISSDNILLNFFRLKKIRIFKRAEVLGLISKYLYTIAIAGTHGKTTTSTMLAHILHHNRKDVVAFLGGISSNYNTNFLMSEKSDLMIVEADEFDRSFLHLHPDIAIITSISADHLDVYDDIDDLFLAFHQFASQVKNKGFLLIENSIDYTFPIPSDGIQLKYSAENKKSNIYVDYVEQRKHQFYFKVKSNKNINHTFKETTNLIGINMPGIHNISNALSASVVASYLGLSEFEINNAFSTFKGINRRFQKHIDNEKVVYIDDYAHHPNEVKATIRAVRDIYPLRKLTVVFQPHLYSRTRDFAKDFAESLSYVDELILLDIYAAREKPIAGITSKTLLRLCNNNNKTLCSKQNLLSFLKQSNLDVLLTLGAGDIGSLAKPIKSILN